MLFGLFGKRKKKSNPMVVIQKKACTCRITELGEGRTIVKGDPACPIHGEMILNAQQKEAVNLLKEIKNNIQKDWETRKKK